MTKFTGVLLLLFLIFSCEGEEDIKADCSLVDCISDHFFLNYIDVDGNPLIGTVFVQDSFKLSSPTKVIYIKPIPFNEEQLLGIFYSDIASNIDYQLELNTTETDTFNFNFTTNEDPCCSNSNMSEFSYNNQTIAPYSDREYTIVR